MLASTRNSIAAVMFVASACASPPSMTGDDDDGSGSGSGSSIALQCAAAIPCPAPSSASKRTICGQLFDLENDARFGDDLTGTACTAITPSGPCSLAIEAVDAIGFGSNPWSATPLAHGAVEVDSCGRFRIPDIDVTGIGPFIAITIDDAAQKGPTGTTVTTAIATFKGQAGIAIDHVEAWIAKESTTTKWETSGGPSLASGVFVEMFRAHKLGTPQTDPFEPQSGVMMTKSGSIMPSYYFDAASLDRATIDITAVATGANGTGLVINASVADSVVYSGSGGLSDPSRCRWQINAGMALPSIVFVQTFRPLDVVGETCPL